jgi:hypothetical protein
MPPSAEVCDPDDFTGFTMVIVTSAHTWVRPEALTDLAGRAADGAWQDKLAAMVAYADRKGWTDDEGRIRAHVEVVTDPGEGPAT